MNASQQTRYPPFPAALYAALLPPELQHRQKDFFIYSAEFDALADGTSDTDTTPIQADSDFFIVQMAAAVNINAGAAVAIEDVLATVELRDTGSGRQLTDAAVAFSTIFGTAQLPFLAPFPKIIQRAGALATTVSNNHGSALDIRISYIGFKLFEQGWMQ